MNEWDDASQAAGPPGRRSRAGFLRGRHARPLPEPAPEPDAPAPARGARLHREDLWSWLPWWLPPILIGALGFGLLALLLWLWWTPSPCMVAMEEALRAGQWDAARAWAAAAELGCPGGAP